MAAGTGLSTTPADLPEDHLFPDDESIMRRALSIALQGLGHTEPNPAVGAVIVDQHRRMIAEGWHAGFGSQHAEVMAIQSARTTRDARMFVTLEPCSHHGKTPPCVDAVIAAEFAEVVVGCEDPAPHASGRGITRLKDAGISVRTGLCHAEARQLIAPFAMLQRNSRPWIHAKWAMTLDGRIAASTGHSRWITCRKSREQVHKLRGIMDAVITGAGTVRCDDPRLTARPPGPRTATRIVLDSTGSSIHEKLRLIQTQSVAPLIVCLADNQPADIARRIRHLGAEVLLLPKTEQGHLCVVSLMHELGRRNMTHVLIEAGAGVTGHFFEAQLIDEVHAFIAPKLVGGTKALSPIGGIGRPSIPTTSDLEKLSVLQIDEDVLIQGRITRTGLPNA
ncbi:MAG: bifunctional diaminohydroxyphosphoribosylaminopyrimidine deaminase/5-amino-6-(5-phosphoribosylamino)uracil reductase RibD [Fuerstiella sp.]|nr:bifunctional diaminohydroxyphosphoribosylaminopyrimidine deaminase/5-amino-6-(5-phosphoribosylamino)uracil reductase RibD [Fuerstiella sp.]